MDPATADDRQYDQDQQQQAGNQPSRRRPELKGVPSPSDHTMEPGWRQNQPHNHPAHDQRNLSSVPQPDELQQGEEEAPEGGDEEPPEDEQPGSQGQEQTPSETAGNTGQKLEPKRKSGGMKTDFNYQEDKQDDNSGKKKKRAVIMAGLASVCAVFIALFIIIHLFTASLKALTAESWIKTRRMASSARNYVNRVTAINADNAALSAADEADAKALIKKSPLGKAIATFKPDIAIRKMRADGVISYKYDAKGRIKTVTVNGTDVEVPDAKLFQVLRNRTKWKQFYKQMYQAMDQALLRDGQSELVRSRVSKAFIAQYGGKLRFWERNGIEESNKTAEEALDDTQKQVKANVEEPDLTVSTGADSKKKGANAEAQKALDQEAQCLADPVCAEHAQEVGVFEASGAGKYVDAFGDQIKKLLKGAHGAVNTFNSFYTIAVPICMVYDSSLWTATTYIRSQVAAAVRAWFTLQSAAEQQVFGAVTGEAVGGFSDFLGDIGASIPGQYTRNEPIDTPSAPFSQATRAQSYSVFSDIFKVGASTVAAAASYVCPRLLKTSTFTAVILATLLVPGTKTLVEKAFSKGAEKIATRELEEKIAVGAIKRFIAKKTGKLEKRVIVNGALKFGAVNGAISGLTEAAVYAARLMVLSEMSALTDGGQPNDFVTTADIGADQTNANMNRMALGGAPMTQPDVVQDNKANAVYNTNQLHQQSVFTRYFALKSNPNSTLARGVIAAGDAIDHPSRIASAFLRIPSLVANVFKPLLHPSVALAAAQTTATTLDTENYNITQWGWTQQENDLMNDDKVGYTYGPTLNSAILKAGDPNGDIAKRYGDCYTKPIEELLTGNGDDSKRRIFIDPDTGQAIYHPKNKDACSGYNLGLANTSFDNTNCANVEVLRKFGVKDCDHLVFRWRLELSYQNTMTGLQDIQNAPETSPNEPSQDPSTAPYNGTEGTDTTSTTTPSATSPSTSADAKTLAQEILKNSNITYPLDASSPNGSTKAVLQALANGQPAPVTCRDGTAGDTTSTALNADILRMIIELGTAGKVGVNAITDKCHTNGSNHYKGKAVDFECRGVPFDTSKADAIAAKYNAHRNSETCSANAHWHYDFP